MFGDARYGTRSPRVLCGPRSRNMTPDEAVARIQLRASTPQHVGCRPATTSTCCGAATPNPIRATSSDRAICAPPCKRRSGDGNLLSEVGEQLRERSDGRVRVVFLAAI